VLLIKLVAVYSVEYINPREMPSSSSSWDAGSLGMGWEVRYAGVLPHHYRLLQLFAAMLIAR